SRAKLFSVDGGMITPAACNVSRNPCRTDQARSRAALDRSSATFNALISLSDTVRENSVHRNTLQAPYLSARMLPSIAFQELCHRAFELRIASFSCAF